MMNSITQLQDIPRPVPCLFTRQEAASRARMSVRALDKRLADGTGPRVTRIGRRVLIAEHHLVAWLEACADPQEDAA